MKDNVDITNKQIDNNKPLLSICIPTYNRCEFLAKSILSIVSQERYKRGDIEIVVSDNDSTDDTKNVVANLANKFANIYYFRNNKNVHDLNFALALERGKGIYRKLSKDSLIFKRNSLEIMCTIIKERIDDRSFIFWRNHKDIINKQFAECDFNSFLRINSYRITDIAKFGLWEDDIKDTNNQEVCFETKLWQEGEILRIVSNSNKAIICNTRLFDTMKVENKNLTFDLFEIFYYNYFRLMQPYVDNKIITTNDLNYLKKDLLLNCFSDVISTKKLNFNNYNYGSDSDIEKKIQAVYASESYYALYQIKVYRLLLKKIVQHYIFNKEII